MNKSDLINAESPEVHQTQKYLDEFAKNNGFFAAIQCSAKENKNVEEIFQTLLGMIEEMQMRWTNEEDSPSPNPKLVPPRSKISYWTTRQSRETISPRKSAADDSGYDV